MIKTDSVKKCQQCKLSLEDRQYFYIDGGNRIICSYCMELRAVDLSHDIVTS